MPERPTQEIPTIRQQAPKPPGLLPKNVQAWAALGVAAGMLLLMWITSGTKKPATAATNAPDARLTPTLTDVNAAKVAEMHKEIERLQKENARTLEAAMEMQRQMQGIQGHAQPGAPGLNTNGGLLGPGGAAGPYATQAAPPPTTALEDSLKAEHRRREYLSLFASNVAVQKGSEGTDRGSGRSNPENSFSPGTSPMGTDPTSDLLRQTEEQIAQLQKLAGSLPPPPVLAAAEPSSPGQPATGSASPAPAQPAKEPNPAVFPTGAFNSAEGKNYVIFEGTELEGLLMNRLDGTFAGPVNCLVTTNVYSRDRQHLLVPAGSKILGEAKPVNSIGQVRLAVLFHRIIMPDGYSVTLDQFKGLNQVGETALRDKVNNHYSKIFGVSLAIGVLGGVAQAGSGNILTQSATDRAKIAAGESLALTSERILDKFLNILPTVTIREGTRVKIYLSSDLVVPDYGSHTVPPNI